MSNFNLQYKKDFFTEKFFSNTEKEKYMYW